MERRRFDASVLLPTLNEGAMVAPVLRRLDLALRSRPFSSEIVVIDDGSTDGTVDSVLLVETRVPVRVIERTREKGLASAIMRGARESDSAVLAVMDADGSHPPDLVPDLIELVLSRKAEMAIASRYVEGGDVRDWRVDRRLLSLGATVLARPLTNGERVRDPMSGFFALDRHVLSRGLVRPIGYKLGFEILVRCHPHPVIEVPFVFQNRVAGKSKLSMRQVTDYIWHVGSLYRYAYRQRFLVRSS